MNNNSKIVAMTAALIGISLCLVLTISSENVSAFSGSGSGTPSDPYQIGDVTQLQEISNELSAHYILVNDIDASETWEDGFDPIGGVDSAFTGTFDGNGYVIENLYIRSDNSYVGLFGATGSGAIIEDVGLENVDVAGDTHVGGLV
ncbi:unnamed protein product, partial [marine sediment metagenome]